MISGFLFRNVYKLLGSLLYEYFTIDWCFPGFVACDPLKMRYCLFMTLHHTLELM